MPIVFDDVYYEPETLNYPLGQQLRERYQQLPWISIQSHNHIPELIHASNRDFPRLKRHLVVGVRKTHRYVENHKISNWLVPYTSSGCSAMCLYCYLVCHYNKCSYLRLFVNREQMMEHLLQVDASAAEPQIFEIGSNSDLVLENTVTGNLPWTIECYAQRGRGKLTFPTKFDRVQPLLALDHRGKILFRMSFNPTKIIKQVEIGAASLEARIKAVGEMARAGYPVGLLIAPMILLPDWKRMYGELIDILAEQLPEAVKKQGQIEVIFMTYSYVQNAINSEAFPGTLPIFDRTQMTGRGRGKYGYRSELKLSLIHI